MRLYYTNFVSQRKPTMSVFSFESVIVGYILFSVVLQPVPENFLIEPPPIGSFLYILFSPNFFEKISQKGLTRGKRCGNIIKLSLRVTGSHLEN